jgi:glycosyltransferase involved in cell wall biosynthesis
MNILHISSTDLMGGRFTGYYMQQALKKTHRVEMAVWNQTIDNPGVHSLRPGKWFRLPNAFVRRCDDTLGLEGLTGMGGWALPIRDYFKRADVVHLHLIHNDAYFSILSLSRLSRLKPLVWTIHDLWAMTGGCLFSFDCDCWLTGCASRCPYPRRKSLLQHHIPALHWQIKKQVYRRLNLDLVVASKWMLDRIKSSPLLKHLPCQLIPFGIDLEMFRPRAKAEARKKLGIWPNQKVIAFRDVGLGDRFKGVRWITEALQLYEPQGPTCLLILQDGHAFRSLWPKYSVITPGWIDGEELAVALSAADVFLMPSIQEAFGLMAIESMACGTPVITFDGTSLPEVIKTPHGGLAVPAKDSVALAGAIQKLLEDDNLRDKLGKQARQIAEQEYTLPVYVQRHLSLYEDAIERHLEKRGLN